MYNNDITVMYYRKTKLRRHDYYFCLRLQIFQLLLLLQQNSVLKKNAPEREEYIWNMDGAVDEAVEIEKVNSSIVQATPLESGMKMNATTIDADNTTFNCTRKILNETIIGDEDGAFLLYGVFVFFAMPLLVIYISMVKTFDIDEAELIDLFDSDCEPTGLLDSEDITEIVINIENSPEAKETV